MNKPFFTPAFWIHNEQALLYPPLSESIMNKPFFTPAFWIHNEQALLYPRFPYFLHNTSFYCTMIHSLLFGNQYINNIGPSSIAIFFIIFRTTKAAINP